MRFELLFFDTVDSSLGRLDYTSLSQQALMEMVIEGITQKEAICGDPDEPKDIEEWKGVLMEDGEVVEIEWRGTYLENQSRLTGPLCLEWLPSSVRKFVVRWNQLTGTLDLTSLPTSMKWLDIGHNACTGEPDGAVASAGLRAQRRSIDPRSRRLAGHRPDGWPSLDGGSV